MSDTKIIGRIIGGIEEIPLTITVGEVEITSESPYLRKAKTYFSMVLDAQFMSQLECDITNLLYQRRDLPFISWEKDDQEALSIMLSILGNKRGYF